VSAGTMYSIRNAYALSVGAADAENEGRLPAVYMARHLRDIGLFKGVTGADIREAVETDEWHRTGITNNRTPFYSMGQVFRCRRELRWAIRTRKALAAAGRDRLELRHCWVEWTGFERLGRGRWAPYEIKRDDVPVTLKGSIAIVHTGRGDVRKKVESRHFHGFAYGPDGSVELREIARRLRRGEDFEEVDLDAVVEEPEPDGPSP